MDSIVKPRESHIFERDEYDWYVEPKKVSARLFEYENFGPKGAVILDPCCGGGNIIGSAQDAGYHCIGSDVVNRLTHGMWPKLGFRQLDFEATHSESVYNWWRQASAIVANPPFDCCEQFLRRALSLMQDKPGAKVAMIWLWRRVVAARWMRNLPLYKVLPISPRPSMPTGKFIENGGRVGGGQQDFAFLIFKIGYDGPPEFDWLVMNDQADRS